jgi:hypothetical protein
MWRKITTRLRGVNLRGDARQFRGIFPKMIIKLAEAMSKSAESATYTSLGRTVPGQLAGWGRKA